MQKLLPLLALLTSLAAPAQGILFQETTLESVLQSAEKTGRFAFVDVYATWCGPCKRMDAEVFSRKEVGNFMNPLFVNARFNGETSEGMAVVNRYGIRSYPTLLFLMPDGTEKKRMSDTSPVELMENAKTVVTSEAYGRIYLGYEQLWNDGDRTPEVVIPFLKIRKLYGVSNEQIINTYLSDLHKDSLHLPQTEKTVVIGTNETTGKGFEYLIAHSSSNRCAMRMDALMAQMADQIVAEKNKRAIDDYLDLLDKVAKAPWEAALKKGEFQARYLLETKQKGEFQVHAAAFAQKNLLPNLTAEVLSTDSVRYTTHQRALENLGWQYGEYVKNKDALQSAYQWLETMNQVQPSMLGLGYQAIIAEKLGNDALSCQKLEATIALAKAQNGNTESWEKRRKGCAK
jgi:thiol-disulfide isomerase/thioredoxin